MALFNTRKPVINLYRIQVIGAHSPRLGLKGKESQIEYAHRRRAFEDEVREHRLVVEFATKQEADEAFALVFQTVALRHGVKLEVVQFSPL